MAITPPVFAIPQATFPRSTEEPKASSDFTILQTWANAVHAAQFVQRTYKPIASNVTAAHADWLVANTGGLSISLPAVPSGSTFIVTVTSGPGVNGGSPITVGAGSTIIQQPGLVAAIASFVLATPWQTVELVGVPGAWVITSGQVDTGWLGISLAAGVTSTGSATPAVRLRGDQYLFRGALSGSGVAALGTTPIAPPRGIFFKGGLNVSGGTTFPAFCTWTTGGALSAPATSAIVLDDVVVNL